MPCFALVAICILSIKSSLNLTNELGYSSLKDLIILNSASAEEGGGDGCTGSPCDVVNGNYKNTYVTQSAVYCCGATSMISGNKSAG